MAACVTWGYGSIGSFGFNPIPSGWDHHQRLGQAKSFALDHPRNNENTAALDFSALMLGASGTCRLAFSLRGAIAIDLQAFDGPQEFSVSIYYNTTMQSVLNGVFN